MDEKERRLQRVTWSTTSRSLLSCDDFNIVLSNITKAVLADHFGLCLHNWLWETGAAQFFSFFFQRRRSWGSTVLEFDQVHFTRIVLLRYVLRCCWCLYSNNYSRVLSKHVGNLILLGTFLPSTWFSPNEF